MKKITVLQATICIALFFSCQKNKIEIAKKEVATIHQTTKPKTVAISQNSFSEKIVKLKADSIQTILKNKDSILSFYQLRNNKPAWTILENRNQLFLAIKNSTKEGLLPKDYQFKALLKIQNQNPAKQVNNIAIDLLYTDVYLSYAYHLANGKIDYSKLYGDWKLPKNKFQYNVILNNGINNNNILKSLNTFKPNRKIYQQLKKTLTKYSALSNTDSLRTIIAYGNKIRPNKKDIRIPNIRKRLQEIGFKIDTVSLKSKSLDTTLQKQIKQFQREKNLTIDAVIGKGTITELNKSYQEKFYSILANLDRWRWYPRNFGKNYIIVNIPNYKLRYYTKKDTIRYNVIVGKKARKTPVFNADIKYLVFNPKWYIPPTIKKEDIIPAAIKNPSSITRKNITIYDKSGKRMHPDSIQWNSKYPSTYRYVQSSGRRNALGLLKIIFPNKFSVFLHDTNHRSLFKKNYRARSSGCVRVENPFKLAGEILRWETSKIDSIIKKRATKRIYLEQKTTVYMLYWSIVFNNNTPNFIHDVYKFDKNIAKILLK